ncbi:unnamed protein product [Rotaria sordida]|uniref:Ras-related protein Rab-5C n=1 Tax=Rotaria sordida TaxID=392033 RepID=A0A819SIZ4_9BILA|nr:unnamed protein product [Rotaria sordida]
MTSNNHSSATGQPAGICPFKMVLLGESAVGKSSLVLRFVEGKFHEYEVSTIGGAYLTQTVSIGDITVKLELWDTAGREQYHSLAPMFYRGAHAAIVVYDITNADTFSRAKVWVKELQHQAASNIIIALAGNNKKITKTQDTSNRSGELGHGNESQSVTGGCCGSKNYSGLSVPIDNKYASSIYSIGFIFTIACCCDDTLASEFGSVQAQNNPRLLTNPFRIVPVGTNDAISLVGCSSIDSLLGATLQFSGYDRERNVTVQIPGPSIE